MFFQTQSVQPIQKLFLGFIIVLLTSWSFPTEACGCGVMILGSDKDTGWEYGKDSTEHAFIAYNDGIEHLLIGLDIKTRDTSAVLVTPIPAPPDQTVADILAVTPEFSGYDVVERAVEKIEDGRSALLASQIYTVPLYILKSFFSNSMGLSDFAIPGGMQNGGIEVYQHIEKEGMIAEVLSAETPDSLYNYLTSKGLAVENNSIPIFKDYISDDFSFVVAWIDPAQKEFTARGITMSFPTDEIFYPLKPNSAYTGTGQDKTVTILGYTTPEIYESIDPYTEVEYRYSEEGLSFGEFIDTTDGFGYTNILIEADPQDMTEDIIISNSAPVRISLTHGINMYPFIGFVILLILISYLATNLSLRLTKPQYKKYQPAKWKLIGANCLTLIGTSIASVYYISNKRFMYVAVFSISFVVLTIVITYGIIKYIEG